MYPNTYFGLFPPFPRDPTVFVAMSFDTRFEPRWSNVIAPAIRQITLGGVHLQPIRVDARRISDSILTEILSGISNSQIVFADVSTIEKIGDRAIRNGNVMYEVGIAHTSRLPEEVLLFRSDNDNLLFDMSNIRINSYDPDNNVDDSKKIIQESVLSALNEIDAKRLLSVRRAADSLDAVSWNVLVNTQSAAIPHPSGSTLTLRARV